MIVIPKQQDYSESNFVFCFEEIENNLHPSLQRRFFRYICERIIDHDSILFLSTHSAVAIDLFSSSDIAQILRVSREDNCSLVESVSDYLARKNLLFELGYHASDLLQCNCIIWVEGPSDAIYVRKWISLLNPDLRDGLDFQCMFYGGRLLSHCSASTPEVAAPELMSLLRINKNAILLIDSDRKSKRSRLNKTKQRLIKEVDEIGGFAWVTKGKEIENYIPKSILKDMYSNLDLTKITEYNSVPEAIASAKKIASCNKVELATASCEQFTVEMIREDANLREPLEVIVSRITEWNSSS